MDRTALALEILAFGFVFARCGWAGDISYQLGWITLIAAFGTGFFARRDARVTGMVFFGGLLTLLLAISRTLSDDNWGLGTRVDLDLVYELSGLAVLFVLGQLSTQRAPMAMLWVGALASTDFFHTTTLPFIALAVHLFARDVGRTTEAWPTQLALGVAGYVAAQVVTALPWELSSALGPVKWQSYRPVSFSHEGTTTLIASRLFVEGAALLGVSLAARRRTVGLLVLVGASISITAIARYGLAPDHFVGPLLPRCSWGMMFGVHPFRDFRVEPALVMAAAWLPTMVGYLWGGWATPRAKTVAPDLHDTTS